MPITSAINGISTPLLTDPSPPDVPADLLSIVGTIDTRLIPRFATTTARDAAITAPISGQVAWVTGVGLTIYDTSLWVPVTTGLGDWAAPGRWVRGLTSARLTATTSAATVLAGPASGRRVLKGLFVNAPTTGQSVTVTVGGVTRFVLPFAAAGIADLDLAYPVEPGDDVQAAVSTGTAEVEVAYADRGDTALDVLGSISSTTGGTVVASSASDRTIGSIVIANTSPSSSLALTLTVAGHDVLTAQTVSPASTFSLDRARSLPSGQIVTATVTGGGTASIVVTGF